MLTQLTALNTVFHFKGEESQDEGCPELLPDNKEKHPSKKLIDDKNLLEKDSKILLKEKEYSDGNTI